jgi:hypothetical protein
MVDFIKGGMCGGQNGGFSFLKDEQKGLEKSTNNCSKPFLASTYILASVIHQTAVIDDAE